LLQYRQGRHAEAASSFRQVVQLSPEDQEAHQALALAMGQVENSISALDESAGES
jgi:Flp pilus assembly protein TadD